MLRGDNVEKIPETPVDQESYGQYLSSLNHVVRKKLYNKYARPEIGQIEGSEEYHGIDGEIINALRLDGSETVVDVGCGDGGFIELLAETCGHQGELIGINDSSYHYYRVEMELEDKPNVQFIEADARQIPLPDESADCITMKFLLYHVDQPGRAIDEALRILKPGGTLLIATRNPGNQGRLWGFLSEVTEELRLMTLNQETGATAVSGYGEVLARVDYSNTSPPETFYSRFDMDRTKSEMLERGLIVTEEYMQSSKLGNSLIYLPFTSDGDLQVSAWSDYEMALLGMQSAFTGTIPYIRDLRKAVERRVKPIFDAEVSENGYFIEYVEQGFVVAKKR